MVRKDLFLRENFMDEQFPIFFGDVDFCRRIYKKGLRIVVLPDARIIHHRAKGGVELGTVKEQRNALGHGNVTFTECGRQYAVSDLERIKRQTVVFVRSILKNVKRYLEEDAYVA